MFSDTRYSLARYSLGAQENTYQIKERFSEKLGALAGVAVQVVVSEKYSDAMGGRLQGTITVLTGLSGGAVLNERANMSANVVTALKAGETLGGTVSGSKDVISSLSLEDDLGGAWWGSKNAAARESLTAEIWQSVHGCKDVLASAVVADALYCVTSATSQTTETAEFTVTIPAGGELRIDSDIYAVYLNGQNALHTQSGDWITISPNLLRISIESATGGTLAGQLIYTERFL